MKYLMGIILAFTMLCGNAMANTIDVSHLTKEQQAALDAMVKNSNSSPKLDLATAGKWGAEMSQAAEGFARAMGVAARELGVAINDFLASDAGKLTAALIIWKIMGKGMLALMFGVILLIISTRIYFKVLSRFTVDHYETSQRSVLFGLFMYEKQVPVYMQPRIIDGGAILFTTLLYILSLLLIMLMIFA